jgi:CheY-like chemotaxis protein
MAGICDVCGRRIKPLGYYPLNATINLATPRDVVLCSAVCLIRLVQSLRRTGDPVAGDAGVPAEGSAVRQPCGGVHSSECWLLLVDDDHAIREVVSEVLVERGYHAVAVSDGEQALACLQSAAAPPCLILLDIMMPVMDGLAFRQRQLTDPLLASIPLVVVCAGTPPDAGFEGATVVRKPLQLQSLLQLVAAWCPPRYLGPRGLPA